MDDSTIHTIVEKVFDKMRLNNPVIEDYTVQDIATLTQSNAHEISMNAEKFYGHYRNGRRHMFTRSEIDYRRHMGMNLQKTKQN